MNFPGPRAFARYMLREGRLTLRPDPTMMRTFGPIMATILYRDGPWQVELVCIPPFTCVPTHRHNRVSSVELALGGSGSITIGERVLNVLEYTLRERLVLTRIPAGVWHGGEVGPDGAMWLSFQQWLEGPVSWLGYDWELKA